MKLWDTILAIVSFSWLTNHKKRKRAKEMEEIKLERAKLELEEYKKKHKLTDKEGNK